jgi:hypothetical protein
MLEYTMGKGVAVGGMEVRDGVAVGGGGIVAVAGAVGGMAVAVAGMGVSVTGITVLLGSARVGVDAGFPQPITRARRSIVETMMR